MRSVALDVHLDFCEVAIVEDGEVRSAGRIDTKPEQIELFAGSLGPDDRVALEVTENAWEIARIIEPHVAQVLVVSPSDTGIRQARAKTDRLDARTLARLLAAGSLDAVWVPDRWTWVMRRRLSRRGQLVHARTRAKNEIHAVLMRQLVGRARSQTCSASRDGSGSPRSSCRPRSARRWTVRCARSSSSSKRSPRWSD
jgi:transposase